MAAAQGANGTEATATLAPTPEVTAAEAAEETPAPTPLQTEPTPYPTATTPEPESTPEPTPQPTPQPTLEPTTPEPTPEPTLKPTLKPTDAPTPFPTKSPTPLPTTKAPTSFPTKATTPSPTSFPTKATTGSPTVAPTKQPELSWNTIEVTGMLDGVNTSRSCVYRIDEAASWKTVNCSEVGFADTASANEVSVSSSEQGETATSSSSSGTSSTTKTVDVVADMDNLEVYASQYAVCMESASCVTGTPVVDANGDLLARLELNNGTYKVTIVAQVTPLTDEETVLLVRSEKLFIDIEAELGSDAIFVSEQMQHVGIALASISYVTIFLLILWQYKHRFHRIVLIGQSDLLLMILFGTTVSTVTILLFAVPSSKACQATSWTYTLGFAITFSGIIGKLWRAHKIFNNRYMKVRKNVRRNLALGSILVVLIDLLILIIWTIFDPLSLEHRVGESQMVNVCTSDSAWIFAGLVLINHGALLVFGLCKANEDKDINRILSEARELRFVLAASIVVPVLIVPLLWVYFDQPDLRYALNSIVVFLTNMSILAICFLPRILHIHYYHTEEIQLARPSQHERMGSIPDISLQVGSSRVKDGFKRPSASESSGKASSDGPKDRISGKVPDSLVRVARDVSARLARATQTSRSSDTESNKMGLAPMKS
ncbi:Metabotropic glutamate receptor-like protein B [Hondaea fermentalgiana]|uniref:Metabotropic glutamate receptor-like protein B n=1 Tax=Hondaea fermentalgiana TaxID=2315210 RepID=A0A2R5GIT8_9STRA|nr:Metabotropic glutamate receptor-like protein B [Hondaea fermentalgiana]|eukprot:GBG30807.1 Metabotropic glutamate receptor-like protein B [Hondaea fermentalgiana]